MGVSVIIPVHNMAATLERAVKSAFAAGANEVLVFDDASTDNTWEICRSLEQDGFSHWRHNYRSGVSHARNYLIDTAENDWIIPLDADDELLRIPPIPQDWREWAYGGWIEHYESGNEETFTAPPKQMINRKPLCHVTMLFSKQLWQHLGGYDPDFAYAEDYGFQCALYAANSNLAIHLDYPLYRRYVGKNERTDKAKQYWDFYHQLAKSKYPNIF